MAKLRLIKPWGLRTVRQHLNDTSDTRIEPAAFVMCSGPVCEIEDVCNARFGIADIRSAKRPELHVLHRLAAPRSTALIVLRFTEPNIR